jgi:hypothetical protein
LAKRWSDCNQVVDRGLTATDHCLEEKRASRSTSSMQRPWNKDLERRACRWQLDEQGLTDKDVHAFCFAGRYGRAGWAAVKQAAVLGGIPLAGGLILLLWGWRRRRAHPRFFRILKNEPERVVWVYVLHLRRRNLPDSRTVQLGLDTGQEIMIHLGTHDSHDEANALVANIAEVVPWAHIGHDDQISAQFKKDPASLRKRD